MSYQKEQAYQRALRIGDQTSLIILRDSQGEIARFRFTFKNRVEHEPNHNCPYNSSLQQPFLGTFSSGELLNAIETPIHEPALTCYEK